MKIFISQPMRGKTDAEILAERERAIKAAKAKWGDDAEVLKSFFRALPPKLPPLIDTTFQHSGWWMGFCADKNAEYVQNMHKSERRTNGN